MFWAFTINGREGVGCRSTNTQNKQTRETNYLAY